MFVSWVFAWKEFPVPSKQRISLFGIVDGSFIFSLVSCSSKELLAVELAMPEEALPNEREEGLNGSNKC
jgi:hypothetical protein